MENRNQFLGINRKTVIFFHRVMLVAMLHSTLIAPSQSIINDVYGSHHKNYISYSGSNSKIVDQKKVAEKVDLNRQSLQRQIVETVNPSLIEKKHENFYVNSDINEGVIGVTNTNPLDDVNDNLFKFQINTII